MAVGLSVFPKNRERFHCKASVKTISISFKMLTSITVSKRENVTDLFTLIFFFFCACEIAFAFSLFVKVLFR